MAAFGRLWWLGWLAALLVAGPAGAADVTIRGLTFSGEAMYTYLDQNLTALPAGFAQTPGDRGTWSFNLRAQRNF